MDNNNDSSDLHDFTYGGYKISDMKNGFRPFDNRFGIVTSYLVLGHGIGCVFAFAVGGMQILIEGGLRESQTDITNKAVSIIKGRIDDDSIKDREEYTYELINGEFEEKLSAEWWIKSR